MTKKYVRPRKILVRGASWSTPMDVVYFGIPYQTSPTDRDRRFANGYVGLRPYLVRKKNDRPHKG